MIPWILPLWNDQSRKLRSFIRKSLEEITGETYKLPDEYGKWHQAYKSIRAAEEEKNHDPDQIARLLREAPGLRLKGRLIELISRQKLIDCGPALLRELGSPDPAHCKRVSEILARLIGDSPPGLEFESREKRAAAEEAWRSFWFEKGQRILAGSRIRKIITLLDENVPASSGGKKSPSEAVDALVQAGRPAIPIILEAMSQPEFSAHLVLALERISGKKLGFRPAPWKAWWEEEGKFKE